MFVNGDRALYQNTKLCTIKNYKDNNTFVLIELDNGKNEIAHHSELQEIDLFSSVELHEKVKDTQASRVDLYA